MEPAVRYADNLAEVVRRGGAVAASSRLLVVRCADCERTYLYDETKDRMFLDPNDLSRVVDEADQVRCGADDGPDPLPPCLGCGRADWEFEDVLTHPDEPGVEHGPWSFCFWTPGPVRTVGPARRIMVAVAVGALALLGAVALVANPDPLGPPDRDRGDVHVPAQDRPGR